MQPPLEPWAEAISNGHDDFVSVVDLENFKRESTGDRVAGVGVPVGLDGLIRYIYIYIYIYICIYIYTYIYTYIHTYL